MPNQIEKSPDGRIKATLETGEVFEGDPLEITQKMAEAHVSTKRWGQEWKQKAETVPPVQPQNPTAQPQNPPVDANAKQLQDYLLTQHAQALGYNTAEEYKAALQKVQATTERVVNEMVAADFHRLNPDFPDTDAATAALGKKMEELHWEWTPGNMTAAHALLVRENAQDKTKGYAPLSAAQINETWANNMQQQNARPAAPPILGGNNPELAPGNNANDPYSMPIAELRKAAIRQELDGKR